MTVREFVFSLITVDPVMNGYGINANTLHANQEPDSPSSDVFGILRWGAENPGLAGQRGASRVTERDVSLWVYDIDFDFTRIANSLKRWQALMDALSGQKTGPGSGDGWITCCEWQGEGDDTWDDVYQRITRWSTFSIVASGN